MVRHAKGLCGYLAKKHHWSKAKENSCASKAKKRGRGRRRRSSRSYSYNPWAVCYSQGLKRGTAKYERCVMHVKAKNRRGRTRRRSSKFLGVF
jgi:hypothetical protein